MIKRKFSVFSNDNSNNGNMLVELLLGVALVAVIMPYVIRYQQRNIRRTENIAIVHEMDNVRIALERYITQNREQLLNTVGHTIIRVNIDNLKDYGINIENLDGARYQLRILKSGNLRGNSSLQGVVVYNADDITPLRTREIVSVGGQDIGFVDGRRTYGTYGTWRLNNVDLGIGGLNGIVKTTAVNSNNTLYLWRVPSDNSADATMGVALNLGQHDLKNISKLNAAMMTFNERVKFGAGIANLIVFQNRTVIDSDYYTKNAIVNGVMSSDGRSMDVAKTFKLEDVGKFSGFNVKNLWVSKLTLPGVSINTLDNKPAILHVNETIDMILGRINAMMVTVGFSGSVTPKLVIHNKISDSVNSDYFWDVDNGVANFNDAILAELNRMAPLVLKMEQITGTNSTQLFSTVASNSNATFADFTNIIAQIQTRVRAKYRLLNLE